MDDHPIAILGAGSWGTALALYLGRRNQAVRIWSIDAIEVEAMQRDRMNNHYLPGLPLPDCIYPTVGLKNTIENAKDILVVVPSVGFRQTLSSLKPILQQHQRIICASKGLDDKTGQLFHEVCTEILGEQQLFAVLSGPSFAKEVAQGLPTAVVIASKDKNFAADLEQRFTSDIFYVDTSSDVVGTELGGVVKNVIAIATGMSDGLGFGTNARSAIITRGLAEITKLGVALGGQAETFVGLAGLGDLILTCSDNQSRNRRFGLGIGEGKDVATVEKEIGQVVEGRRNAELVLKLAQSRQVKMPICETISDILHEKFSPLAGMQRLMSRV